MVLPCGPVFFPAIAHKVQAALHAVGRVRSHIGHHVVHPIRHAVHALGVHPVAVIGAACRTAPGWTAAGLLALPILQPLQPAPTLPPATAAPEVQGVQVLDGAAPVPVQQSSGGPSEGSTGATSAPHAANADASTITPRVAIQPETSVFFTSAPFPLLPAQASTPRPAPTVLSDKIAKDIASEVPDTPHAVPEPSSLLVLTTGFYSLKWLRRRRQPFIRSST